ncbi:hypothetical protein SISNIDRAFT_482430 [Sistotremastrum niveocremeum HHB9708]|uniref:Uncharacterized protein n=1 Tax=Sistotremastrum niveocremeum HHB9708 TaxID=1314777 RepID=A0A164Y6Q3_9AGAM|nr:hypothetical protein SISNIDRAFT_482430 [Sistotremastrum niveocremeum HHB9708]
MVIIMAAVAAMDHTMALSFLGPLSSRLIWVADFREDICIVDINTPIIITIIASITAPITGIAAELTTSYNT